MAWNRMKIAFLAVPFLLLLSCGTDPRSYNDNGDGSSFRIASMLPTDLFNAFQPFEDFGCDGVEASPPDTPPDVDGSEGNGWPDSCEGGPTFRVDQMTFTFTNEARPGVTDPPPLRIVRMDVSYRDGNGQTRVFAPPKTFFLTETVPTNGSLELTTNIDDYNFKLGVFQAMEAATSTEDFVSLWTWDFIADVYAVEDLSGNEFVARGAVTVGLHSPAAAQ